MTTISDHLRELGLAPLESEYAPLNSYALNAISLATGHQIPEDYRSFVTEYGGSYFPEGHICIKPLENPPSDLTEDGTLEAGVFLGGDESKYDLRSFQEIMSDRIPREWVLVSQDLSCNFFVLDLTEGGVVRFWSTRHETFTLVANSFSEFVLAHELVENEEDAYYDDINEKLFLRFSVPSNPFDDEDAERLFDDVEELVCQKLSANSLGQMIGGDWDDQHMTLFVSTSEASKAIAVIAATISQDESITDPIIALFDQNDKSYLVRWPEGQDGEHVDL